MTKIAVLDDWQGVARSCADWSRLEARAQVVFHTEPLGTGDAAVAALADCDVILTMRERAAFPAALIARLPKLKMLGMTGARAPVIDIAALTARGVVVCSTGGQLSGVATAELALGLMLAAQRRLPRGDASIRAGGFQDNVGMGFACEGRTLGLLGLGRIGQMMAKYGRALGMRTIAWSQNLTEEAAAAGGAQLVSKAELLKESDAISIHLVLSDRTRGILASDDLALVKPGAILINTSRGPLVEEAALIAAVTEGRIIAALDTYDIEPLPKDHPLRTAPNTVLSPHVGYCVREVFEQFYRESVENALAFLDGAPVRVVNPEALGVKH